MSRSLNQFGLGLAAGPAHVLRYLPNEDSGADQRFYSGVTIRDPDAVRGLDDIGHAVTAGDVPDFWKPFEDWTLD